CRYFVGFYQLRRLPIGINSGASEQVAVCPSRSRRYNLDVGGAFDACELGQEGVTILCDDSCTPLTRLVTFLRIIDILQPITAAPEKEVISAIMVEEVQLAMLEHHGVCPHFPQHTAKVVLKVI